LISLRLLKNWVADLKDKWGSKEWGCSSRCSSVPKEGSTPGPPDEDKRNLLDYVDDDADVHIIKCKFCKRVVMKTRWTPYGQEVEMMEFHGNPIIHCNFCGRQIGAVKTQIDLDPEDVETRH
jgi:hypothetical protein